MYAHTTPSAIMKRYYFLFGRRYLVCSGVGKEEAGGGEGCQKLLSYFFFPCVSDS